MLRPYTEQARQYACQLLMFKLRKYREGTICKESNSEILGMIVNKSADSIVERAKSNTSR